MQQQRQATSSGTLVVAAMVGAGLLAALIIFLYWKARLGPHVPLIRALAVAFPRSAPRVEGGDLPGETGVLRVILKVDYAPEESDPRVAQAVEKVLELARAHAQPGKYQTLELYLVQYIPERAARRLRVARPMASGPGP